jgi:hypothetical protein
MKKVPMKTLSIVMETESPIHTVLPMMAIAAILRRQVIAMTRGPKVSCHIRQLARNLARVPAAGVLPAVPIHTASIVTGMEFPIHTALTELEITASVRQRITAQTLGPTVHRPLAKRGRAHLLPAGAVMLALVKSTTRPIVMETELPTHFAIGIVTATFFCHRNETANGNTFLTSLQHRTRARKFRSYKMEILRKVMLARLLKP